MFSGRFSGETALALGLLLFALGVDLFWLRPRLDEARALTRQKTEAESSLWNARSAELRSKEIVGYLAGDDSTLAALSPVNALGYLESQRNQAGLRRLDLRLERRETVDGLVRTSYVMQVRGDFHQHLVFLKSLELGRPVVNIDTLEMTTPATDPKVTAKLRLNVMTLDRGGS